MKPARLSRKEKRRRLRTSRELLTIPEAAMRTKRKPSTWRSDILLRKIPYVKIGRQVRIPVEVVDQLISDGWREPKPVVSGEISGAGNPMPPSKT